MAGETKKTNSGVRIERPLTVTLEDKHLWNEFNSGVITNEMIVTKNGRLMFPVVAICVTGLNPNDLYSLAMEFVQVEDSRWKYDGGHWTLSNAQKSTNLSSSASCSSSASTSSTIYTHPDSPNFGSHWMKDAVSFAKVKITNKSQASTGQIVLKSLHKYQPCVHLIRLSPENEDGGSYEQPCFDEGLFKVSEAIGSGGSVVASFSFPETSFIAVTAYYSEEIRVLKIKHNDFAKPFRKSNGVSKSNTDRSTTEDKRLTLNEASPNISHVPYQCQQGNCIASRSQYGPLHSMHPEISSSSPHTYSCRNHSSYLSFVQLCNNDHAHFSNEVTPYDDWRYSSGTVDLPTYSVCNNYNLSKRDFDQGHNNPVSQFHTDNHFHSDSYKRQCRPTVNTRWTPYDNRW